MIDQVSPPQWNDWMAQHAAQGPALLLDVREDWEVQTASVRPEGYELVHIPMGQLVQRLADASFQVTFSTPEGLTQFIRKEADTWKRVITEAKIPVD